MATPDDVIFRMMKNPDGTEVPAAFFVKMPGMSTDPSTIMCYTDAEAFHPVGTLYYYCGRRAKPAEYLHLLRKLESMGRTNLAIRTAMQNTDRKARERYLETSLHKRGFLKLGMP
jgi:hypothetical protein